MNSVERLEHVKLQPSIQRLRSNEDLSTKVLTKDLSTQHAVTHVIHIADEQPMVTNDCHFHILTDRSVIVWDTDEGKIAQERNVFGASYFFCIRDTEFAAAIPGQILHWHTPFSNPSRWQEWFEVQNILDSKIRQKVLVYRSIPTGFPGGFPDEIKGVAKQKSHPRLFRITPSEAWVPQLLCFHMRPGGLTWQGIFRWGSTFLSLRGDTRIGWENLEELLWFGGFLN